MASIKWEIKEGPNGEVQKQPTITWPNGNTETLPILPEIPPFNWNPVNIARERPDNKNLDPILQSFSEFVLYMWYELDGRSMVPEDIASTMCMVFYGKDYSLKNQTMLLTRFDDPKDPMTRAFESVGDEVKAHWIAQASTWYEKVRKIDPVVEARAADLAGLSNRLESYQICNLYGVIFMTKDHDGFWTELRLRQIFAHYLNYSPNRIPKSLAVNLADANDGLTQEVAAVAEDERYRPWIKNSAENIVNRYFIENLKQEPRFITASAHPRNLPETTTSMSGLALTATASGSRQPTGSQDRGKERARGPSVGLPERQNEDYCNLVNWDGNESEPPQAKGKGKEKVRGRESSSSASNSPEGKGSGGKKPAAKKIRSAGGKQ
ncbi:MAG: hypothetical protein Q9161_005183 [Pseudevernia consocians]